MMMVVVVVVVMMTAAATTTTQQQSLIYIQLFKWLFSFSSYKILHTSQLSSIMPCSPLHPP